MIYVNKEWLFAKEALVVLANLSRNSHKIFDVCCDFKTSDKCSNIYSMEYRRFIKVTEENNNKLICLFCSRKNKFSGRNNPNTKYSFDDQFFNTIDSKEKAYLMGWIASDGHIGKRGFKISIHQKDIKILEYFQRIMCPQIPIRFFQNQSSKMCSFEINSQNISNALCEHLKIKPGKKSHLVALPQLNEDYIWHFVRGYFDGDGSLNDKNISKYKYIKGNIRSNSIEMLKSIKKIHNDGGSITNNSLHYSNKKMLRFLDKIYKDSGELKLERKYKRYIDWKT